MHNLEQLRISKDTAQQEQVRISEYYQTASKKGGGIT